MVDTTEHDGGGDDGGPEDARISGCIVATAVDAACRLVASRDAANRAMGNISEPNTPDRSGGRTRARAEVAASPARFALAEQDDEPEWLREAELRLRGAQKSGAATRREKARVAAWARIRHAAAAKLQHAWRTHYVRVARVRRAAEDAEALKQRRQEARARLDAREEEERRKRRQPKCEPRKRHVAREAQRARDCAAVVIQSMWRRRGARLARGRLEAAAQELRRLRSRGRRERRGRRGHDATKRGGCTLPLTVHGAVPADAAIEFELREGRIFVKGCVKPFLVSDLTWEDAPTSGEVARPRGDMCGAEASGGEGEAVLARRREALESELDRQSEAMTAAWMTEVNTLRAEMERLREQAEAA